MTDAILVHSPNFGRPRFEESAFPKHTDDFDEVNAF